MIVCLQLFCKLLYFDKIQLGCKCQTLFREIKANMFIEWMFCFRVAMVWLWTLDYKKGMKTMTLFCRKVCIWFSSHKIWILSCLYFHCRLNEKKNFLLTLKLSKKCSLLKNCFGQCYQLKLKTFWIFHDSHINNICWNNLLDIFTVGLPEELLCCLINEDNFQI